MELLEREQPLAQLAEHVRQASDGHGRMVLIGGEAGVGKTALVDAFARGAGLSVLRTWCDALSTPAPLGPVRDLAPLLGLTIDDRPLDAVARERLFRDVLAALAARPEPAIVIAEDAHWADGATLELLRFLGRRIGGLRTLLIVTYRDDEIGAHHPLRLVLGDLATAPTLHRMALSPLSQEAVGHLAEGHRDAASLHHLTGGNPFFLKEVLASTGDAVPASVGDAVLARAARLCPEARATLDVAAVLGTTFDPDLLLAISGPVLDEVDECITRGLLMATHDGLAFRHALVREAIYRAIAPPRGRLLHARVLGALRSAPEDARTLAQRAHHAEAAGDRAAVLEFAIAAAQQATRFHAHREAAAQYARALRYAEALPAMQRAQLLEAMSVACYLSDRGEEAIAARQEALALWREIENPLKEGENLRWLARLFWFQGRGAEAEDAAEAARSILETQPPGSELALVYTTLSELRMLGNNVEETLLWGDRAIALAERLDDPQTPVEALVNVGSARFIGEDPAGEEELERGLRLALTHGLLEHAARAWTNLAWTTMWAMRLEEAERRFAAGLAFTLEHDQDFLHRYLLAGQATLLLRQGAWEDATAACQHILQLPMLSPITRTMALTTWGQICARQGSPEATTILDEALALAEGTGQLMRLGPVRAARAEAALLDGDVERARAEIESIRVLVFTRGNRWLRGEFAWLLWRTGERDMPLEHIAEPYRLQIAGDMAAAAEAWHAIGAPYEEGCALAASDDPTLVRRALPIFERLGAVPGFSQAAHRLRALGVRDVPATRRGPLASTRANPAGLTRREIEVLALVTEGLRNPEIAEQLYLTPKTVSHHLTAIFAKLGVTSRIEAARAAAKLGVLAEN